MNQDYKIEKTLTGLFEDIKFAQNPQTLYDPLRYMISIGGKRIRPRLCLTAYSLFKDTLDEAILGPAAALEVFHSFTLIHDDIMDNSDKRRGQPTVWTKWGQNTAILSGDVMSIDSYRRIASCPKECLPEVLEVFSQTAAQVCEGQQMDMDFEEMKEVGMADYMKMIGLKTAVLLACSAKIGAIIGGAPKTDVDALYDYGYDLGLAFQVEDDYLDVYGEEKVFGKPIGGDILNGKKSWLLTRALEKCRDKKRLFDLMALPAETHEQKVAKVAFVKAEFNQLGVAEDAKNEIEALSKRAMSHVINLDKNSLLKDFTQGLVGRAK